MIKKLMKAEACVDLTIVRYRGGSVMSIALEI